MELLIESLKLELENEDFNSNIISLEDLVKKIPRKNHLDEYEPDYYEETD